MKILSIEQVLEKLRAYGAPVHCELYRRYQVWYATPSPGTAFYEDRGCVVVTDAYRSAGTLHLFYNLHQVAPNAELHAVKQDWEARLREKMRMATHPNALLNVLCVAQDHKLPKAFSQVPGWYHYTCAGRHEIPHAQVRKLDAHDQSIFQTFCAQACAVKDTSYGTLLASDLSCFPLEKSDRPELYGLFADGRLQGVATAEKVSELGLAWLEDVYVLPSARGKGYGKALVSTALSPYPTFLWHYQCGSDNAASMRLASALGFSFAGASCLFPMPEDNGEPV